MYDAADTQLYKLQGTNTARFAAADRSRAFRIVEASVSMVRCRGPPGVVDVTSIQNLGLAIL
jgi:hypothetical protein